MSSQLIGQALQAVSGFAQTTREAVKDNPALTSGTPEDLVARVAASVFEFYEDADRLRATQLLDEFLKDAIFRKIVASIAAEPQLGLAEAGPHLLFAEAWTAYATVEILMQNGQLELNEIMRTVAFACCHSLKEWSKTGYRLDWHPRDAATKGPDPSAPVGRWTQQQARA